jgi:hypothetical protein
MSCHIILISVFFWVDNFHYDFCIPHHDLR